MSQKKVVVALGGNALGNNLEEQRVAVKITARALVDLVEEGHQVVVVHGNGPQVGTINNAMTGFAKETNTVPVPLSISVAMSQAYIGYDLQNALQEELRTRAIDIPVATVVTQIRVDEKDPAFAQASKPIGAFMTKEEGEKAEKEFGFQVKEDAGRGYRRVVASPKPQEIVEIATISTLVEQGNIVIACGGGGIPVVKKGNALEGVGAVIDKDFASCFLAEELDADFLVILTAVEKVAIHFNTPEQKELESLTPAEAEKYKKEGHFAAGSMLPKVEAATRFAQSKAGREALITLLEKAKDGIHGKTGTRIKE